MRMNHNKGFNVALSGVQLGARELAPRSYTGSFNKQPGLGNTLGIIVNLHHENSVRVKFCSSGPQSNLEVCRVKALWNRKYLAEILAICSDSSSPEPDCYYQCIASVPRDTCFFIISQSETLRVHLIDHFPVVSLLPGSYMCHLGAPSTT